MIVNYSVLLCSVVSIIAIHTSTTKIRLKLTEKVHLHMIPVINKYVFVVPLSGSFEAIKYIVNTSNGLPQLGGRLFTKLLH